MSAISRLRPEWAEAGLVNKMARVRTRVRPNGIRREGGQAPTEARLDNLFASFRHYSAIGVSASHDSKRLVEVGGFNYISAPEGAVAIGRPRVRTELTGPQPVFSPDIFLAPLDECDPVN